MSAGIGAVIAHAAFWILLAAGWWSQELRVRGVTLFVLLWTGGWFGLRFIPFGPQVFFSWVAVLDVALVFIIFKGDVRLT